MPNYRISSEVPWSEVLGILRRRVQMRMHNCQMFLSGENAGQWEEQSFEIAKEQLRKSLHTYSALRAFLGYSSQTQVETEAQEFLEAEAHHRHEA